MKGKGSNGVGIELGRNGQVLDIEADVKSPPEGRYLDSIGKFIFWSSKALMNQG